MASILLAEDDRVVRKTLIDLFEGAGYAVCAVRDGARAVASFREKRPDVVVLDVMMPVKDGLAACREIRVVDEDVPILFLTALDTEKDELAGLGIGADDYISKSASDEVLLARIAAALRRTMKLEAGGDFSIGPWRVSSSRLEMACGSNRESLKEKEIAILRMFATHPGEIFTRDGILTRFWADDDDANDNALSLVMHRLREKLGPRCTIETVRSIGYVYRP